MHGVYVLEIWGSGEGLGWRILRVKWMVFLNSTHKTEQSTTFSHVNKFFRLRFWKILVFTYNYSIYIVYVVFVKVKVQYVVYMSWKFGGQVRVWDGEFCG